MQSKDFETFKANQMSFETYNKSFKSPPHAQPYSNRRNACQTASNPLWNPSEQPKLIQLKND